MIQQILSRYHQFLLFSMIGVVNTGVHGSVLMVCIEMWGLAVVLSHLVSFSIANVISFALNSVYTFHTKITFRRYAKFWAASMISLGLTLSLSWIFKEFGFHYMVGFMFIIVAVPIVSFLIMKFWAFSAKGA